MKERQSESFPSYNIYVGTIDNIVSIRGNMCACANTHTYTHTKTYNYEIPIIISKAKYRKIRKKGKKIGWKMFYG